MLRNGRGRSAPGNRQRRARASFRTARDHSTHAPRTPTSPAHPDHRRGPMTHLVLAAPRPLRPSGTVPKGEPSRVALNTLATLFGRTDTPERGTPCTRHSDGKCGSPNRSGWHASLWSPRYRDHAPRRSLFSSHRQPSARWLGSLSMGERRPPRVSLSSPSRTIPA